MSKEAFFSKSVRDTGSTSTMSEGSFNFMLGLVLCWGFFINWVMVSRISAETYLAYPSWALIVGFLVLSFAGIALFKASENPVVSFFGYNMMVVAFGPILSIVVSEYDSDLVFEAIQTTGLVTAVMMLAATIFPAFFKRLGGVLFIALLAMIVIELVQAFVFHVQQGWTDWAVALIFCGYIGFNWVRANEMPRTLDNAIDCAAELYLDIINLFVRILQIMGNKD